MSRTGLFPYPEQRVLEDAAFARGVVPTRIFALLLPVWCVSIQADVTEAEDYELIDRYLARGIAEGALTTTAELAEFYALEPELVDRALRALSAIGHLHTVAGRWALTELGVRSVQDKRRYVRTREDRRKLYFDAFGSRPLTRPYYDSRKVTLLTADAAMDLRLGDGPQFQMLYSTRGFDGRALAALAANPHRDRFNLPERIDHLRRLGPEELVFLPLYVVRGLDSSRRPRFLAYGQASAEADPDLGDLVDQVLEVVRVLEAEAASTRPQDAENRARAWSSKRNVDECRPVWLPSGLLRLLVPARGFGDDEGKLSSSRVGSFVVLGNSFFQLWCDDDEVRRGALVNRADSFPGVRSRVDRDQLQDWVARISRQLDLGTVDLAELRRLATEAGHDGLVTQLTRIA
ncbi:MAG: hypothetical protein M3443_08370 [Actinomycetota bacterium]|nr:hypothetical protein [Actinomycetota bacterium]